jgi:putative Flp pilus-assembly TadE/G-like protein
VVRLVRSRDGSVAILTALLLSVLLGFTALGVEASRWYLIKRSMQGAADAAVLSAAIADAVGAPFESEGKAIAAQNGYEDGLNNVAVAVHRLPYAGQITARTSGFEAIIQQPQAASLVAALNIAAPTVKVHSVASAFMAGSCALALDPTASASFFVDRGGDARFGGCGFAVASNSATAFKMQGGGLLQAGSGIVHGGDTFLNGTSPTIPSGKLRINVASDSAFSNPYALRTISFSGGAFTLSRNDPGNAASQTISNLGTSSPAGNRSVPPISTATCSGSNGYSTGNTGTFTLTPGVYPCGIDIHNGAIVKMTPGIYIIDRGAFTLGGATQLQGLAGGPVIGVTIVLTSSTGANWATISLANGSVVRISAPTSGPTAGLVIWDDIRSPLGSASTPVTGGASLDATGAIYMPHQDVTFNNGATITSTCLELIANQIIFTGGASFNNSCSGTGVVRIGGGNATVVE